MSLNGTAVLVASYLTFPATFWVMAIIVDKILNYRRHDCAHGVRGQCAKCDDEKAAEQRAQRVAAEAAQRRQAREQLKSKEAARLRETIVPSIAELRKLSPYEFEDEIARVFKRLGYSVEQTPCSNDYGRDAILMKDGEKFLLECKKYGDGGSSGRPDLQKFHSAIISDKAKGGFFVTSGGFSVGALKFAPTANIKLIDAHELPRLMFKSLNSASQGDWYSSMCLECDDVVQHHIRSPEANTTCRNGHTVPATLSIDDIFSVRRRREGQRHQSTRPLEGREASIRRWDGALGYGFIDSQAGSAVRVATQTSVAVPVESAPVESEFPSWAVTMLKKDPKSHTNRDEFDEVFGKGAAGQVLGDELEAKYGEDSAIDEIFSGAALGGAQPNDKTIAALKACWSPMPCFDEASVAPEMPNYRPAVTKG